MRVDETGSQSEPAQILLRSPHFLGDSSRRPDRNDPFTGKRQLSNEGRLTAAVENEGISKNEFTMRPLDLAGLDCLDCHQ
jgi:hypothetical protein